MDKAQLDRLDMALTIENYLKKNSKLISSNTPLVATTELLSSKITAVKDQMALQLINNKGTTVEKRKRRTALENQAFILASGCCSYALSVGNEELYNRCYFSRSAFVHFKDMELVGTCVNLLREISNRVSELSPYNISSVMIADFESAIYYFLKIVDKPKEERSRKAAATAKITSLLTEISNIIWRRLESNMVSMDSNHPEFVAVYKNLRSIKKTPVQKRCLTVVAIDSDTKIPISNVQITIGKNLRRTSGRKGMSYVQYLPDGRHQLMVTHNDYISKSLKFWIPRGQRTRVEMFLERAAGEQQFADDGQAKI